MLVTEAPKMFRNNHALFYVHHFRRLLSEHGSTAKIDIPANRSCFSFFDSHASLSNWFLNDIRVIVRAYKDHAIKHLLSALVNGEQRKDFLLILIEFNVDFREIEYNSFTAIHVITQLSSQVCVLFSMLVS
nr:MAG TPA: Protein of unknown function (DUF2618) [Caudoviricetes sp.]